ncbi:MAG: hypothetical protein KC473_05125 [Candidatus Dadabacteria bacterium]|nr:hypothetical protein [Candidatus Dadabacteria bacterium]
MTEAWGFLSHSKSQFGMRERYNSYYNYLKGRFARGYGRVLGLCKLYPLEPAGREYRRFLHMTV